MRITLSFGFQRFIACLLAIGIMTATASADPYSPMFGDYTISVKGDSYAWLSAWEDSTYHYDTYENTSTSAQITVTGAIAYPYFATVVGTGIDGHLELGTYEDNVVTTSGSAGYSAAGYSFTDFSSTTTYTPDISAQLLSHVISTSYWGPYGTYSEFTDVYNQLSWDLDVSSSESGVTFPRSGEYSPSQLGVNFTFDSGDYSFAKKASLPLWSPSGSPPTVYWDTTSWTDHYTGPDGATLTITYSGYMDTGYIESSSATLWTSFLGSVSTSAYPGSFPGFGSVTWNGLSGPKFAPAQIWVKEKGAPESTRRLLSWQSSPVTSGGVVIDQYGTGDLLVAVQGGPAGGNEVFVNGVTQGEYDEEDGFSNTGTYEILTADDGMDAWIDDEPFFNAATSLWVDGTQYPFRSGYRDASGTRVDVYENPSAGTVTLLGDSSDATQAELKISHMGVSEDGAYDDGDFVTYLFLVTTEATSPVYGPLAWWVDGRLLSRSAPGSTTFTDGVDSITVTSSDSGATLDVTGTVNTVSITGSLSGTAAGIVFMDNTAVPSTTVALARANADGSLILGTGEPPENFPPAIMALGQGLWRLLGSATVEDVTTAWYAHADPASVGDPADARAWLLAVAGTGAATLTNLTTDEVYTGTYSTTTHLFQTTAGEVDALPFRLIAVDSTTGAAWGLGGLPEGLPPSLRVRGQPWWYAGTDENGISTYLGFYDGQVMTVGPLENGARAITLIDPVHNAGATNPNAATYGSLGDVRGGTRLRDGTLVTPGGDSGEATPTPVVDTYQVHTIASDLDIVGNNLSFGVLPDDASISGALFQFGATSSTATLHSILSKPQARWGWWQAGATEADAPAPVMWLDEAHRLKLYPTTSSTTPGIVLDPGGTTTFTKPVRVPPGGDISMGEFHNPPLGD